MQRDVEIEMTFLPPEHGGRAVPAHDGYRSQFYYDGHDWDARYEFQGVEVVNPGEKVRAYLAFLSPKEHLERLYPGMAFLIRGGNKIVGYGSVARIIDLEASAKRK